jgi:hypothetical protein
MLQRASRAALAALFLASIASALAHGDDHEMDMSTDVDMDHSSHDQTDANDSSPMSYFAYGKHTGWIVAHIALMVVAWCFVLPTGMTFFHTTLSDSLKVRDAY